jgi:hypothetical protein
VIPISVLGAPGPQRSSAAPDRRRPSLLHWVPCPEGVGDGDVAAPSLRSEYYKDRRGRFCR